MTELRLLLDLAGAAALLLWGLHMVQTGVQRAFGGRLRQALGLAMGDRARAFAAGMGVTMALQSSTATILMLGGFAATGAVALVPALAAVLGANLGTAVLVQVLAFHTAALWPPLVLGGVVAFRRGARTRTRDLGRTAVGLGLLLLALQLMGAALAPVEASPTLRALLGAVADQPLANLLLAAVVAWAAHSSVAGVLFVASLAGGGAVGTEAAVAMVIGANLGSALNPLLEAGGDAGDRARLRLPVGNLLNRAAGAVLALAALPWIAGALHALAPAPAHLVAMTHLGFNVATAALAFPLLPATARLLRAALPDRPAAAQAGAPRYLDEAALATPPVALANAAREALRMADALEGMLAASAEAFRGTDRHAARAVGEMDDAVDRLHRAVDGYLGRLPAGALGEAEARRLAEVRGFAAAVELAADVVERDVVRRAARRLRLGIALTPGDEAAIAGLHAALREQLRLAVAVLVLEDAEAARRLVRATEGLRAAERAAAARLAEGGDSAALALEAVRDLRRVGGHLAAAAHPLLERRGGLRASRVVEGAGAADG